MSVPWAVALVGALVSLAAHPAFAFGTETEPSSVALRPVELRGLPEHQGQRYLTSDGSDFYVLLAGSEPKLLALDEAFDAELVTEFDHELWAVNSVAVSRGGQRVLVRAGIHGVRLFERGEERELPPATWMVAGVAVADGRPVVALAPIRFEATSGEDLVSRGGFAPDEPPPAIARLAGKRWTGLVRSVERERPPAGVRPGIRGQEVWLVGSQSGELLHAHQAAYDVRVFNQDAKLVARLRGEGGLMETEDVLVAESLDEAEVLTSDLTPEQKDKLASGGNRKSRVKSKVLGLGFADPGFVVVVSADPEGQLQFDRHARGTGNVERCHLGGFLSGTTRRATVSSWGVVVWPARLETTVGVATWAELEECDWTEALDVEIL